MTLSRPTASTGSATQTTALIDRIASALETRGYAVLSGVFDPPQLEALFVHFKSLDDAAFDRAGIGRSGEFQTNRSVRTDRIHWLEPGTTETLSYFEWAEQLRLGLNRRLFLGLFDYECHFAWYPEGSYYKRHVDAFKGANSRMISTILYLNPAWQPGDGGELVIYAPDSDEVLETVEPVYGRMVMFLSKEFPHEVLPARQDRYSLTGWYRLNPTDSQVLDPSR